MGKLTLAPMLKTQTSSGACASASDRNLIISSSFRASSERPNTLPPAASISLTSGASFSPWRRPTKTVKPSAANFLAISPPIKSPAPTTATVAFRFSKAFLQNKREVRDFNSSASSSGAAQRFRQPVFENLPRGGCRQGIQQHNFRGPLV